MYQFCVNNSLRVLWAYLWTNWYSPSRWYLWARSARSTIPLSKTTMKIEAHWSVIKRCYLHRFSSPRLDLMFWTLLDEVIPTQNDRLSQVLNSTISPCWWEAFKKEWNYLGASDERRIEMRVDKNNKGKKKLADPQSTDLPGSYFTEVSCWVCSCPAFVVSRFLMCKHLVRQVINMPNGTRRRLIREDFERRTTPPFLIIKNLDYDEFINSVPMTTTIFPSEAFDNINEDPEKEVRTYVEEKWPLIERAIKRIRTERSSNNWRHVRAMIDWSRLADMEEEIESVERKRHRQVTWTPSNKKPYLMYLPLSNESEIIESDITNNNDVN